MADAKEKSMNRQFSGRIFVIGAAALLAGAFVTVGCNHRAYPDQKAAVTDSLKSNNLGAVSISQDREKGIMTLSGNLDSQDMKMQAENLARQAAPNYTIDDEIGVRPTGVPNAGAVASNMDDAIEDNFKAAIKAHENLNDQSIRGSAKNGTLVLKGSVKTDAQRQEAEQLARKVPNVQQVVNEIEVKPGKHSLSGE
jgi:hyperosmotically inducible periplasmic protein